MVDDDLDLNQFEQTEEPTPGKDNGGEPEVSPGESNVDESIVASEALISAAKRMGGFGLQGETRRAFEEEFGGIANLISKIMGVDDASKIMSLKNSMSDEYRLLGGVLGIAGSAGLWRLIINEDMKRGGQITPSSGNGDSEASPGSAKSQAGSDSEKDDPGEDNNQSEQPKPPGNMNFQSFHDLED